MKSIPADQITVEQQDRQRIPAEFAEGSAIIALLPRLPPPEASVHSGSWDAIAP